MNSKSIFTKRTVALVVAALASVAAHAVDSFDSTSNLLTLDSVTMTGTTYRNVAVTVNSYSLVGIAGGSPAADTFDPASNTLVLGAVAFQGTTYNNATVKINSYTLLSAGGPGTPGTLATNAYTGEMAGYLAQLNTYRTQCGISALSQNTLLDAGAVGLANVSASVTSVTVATGTGYAVPSTVGGVVSDYLSNSTNNAMVGQLELQTALMDPGTVLNLMRPYTEVGLAPQTGHAGATNSRFANVMLGNPAARNTPSVVTFPCANTVDVAPYTSSTGGLVFYASTPATAQFNSSLNAPNGTQGTPIAVFANVGQTLVLTNAAVTDSNGARVPVTLLSSDRTVYPYEGYVWPQANLQPNTAYSVVIFGTVNGAAFSKAFTFRTGAAITLSLP